MKKFTIRLLLTLAAVAIFSCAEKAENNYKMTETADGVKIFSNGNKPSDTTIKFEPKLLFSISGEAGTADSLRAFSNIADIDFDEQGNIYLFDMQKGSIKKFDSQGNYLLSFGGRGTGPGEFPFAYDIAVQNGSVYVQSFTNLQMVRYSLDGKFIENITYTSGGLSVGEALRPAGKGGLLLGYINSTENREGVYYFGNNLVIFGPDFKEKARLREWNEKFDPADVDFFKSICRYTSSEDKIFVAENSITDYKINVFDINGKKIEEIKKPYARIQNNDEEEAYIKQSLQLNVDGQALEQKKTFKRSVNDLFIDRYGRLLARKSVERKAENKDQFIVDVFKDGIFLNTVTIPGLIGQDIMVNFANTVRFFGDKIYQVIPDEAKVNVYTY
jgi:hypothetical protein